MKFTFIILLLSITNVFGQNNYAETINDFGLKKGVIETEDIRYTLELLSSLDNTPVEQYAFDKIIKRKFNTSGLLINETKIKASTLDTLNQSIYLFNETNQLIKYSSINGRTRLDTENIYDRNKQLIEQSFIQNDELKRKYTLQYLDNKILKLTLTNAEKKEEMLAKTYNYNESNKLISTEEINNIGYRNTLEVIYEDGTETHIESRFNKDLLKSKRKIIFDENGIKSKETNHNFNSKGVITSESVKEFNSNGLLSRFSSNKGERSDITTTTYDDFENPIIEEFKYINDDNVKRKLFSYKYDKKGNWIIKCHKRYYNPTFGTEPIAVTVRNLKYVDEKYSRNISKHETLSFCDPEYKTRLKKFLIEEENNTDVFIKEIDEN